MSVFTSLPAKSNVTPTLAFKEMGNGTDVAAKLTELHIFGAQTYVNLSWDVLIRHLPAQILANWQGTPALCGNTEYHNITGITIPNNLQLVDDPEVGITFTGKPSEKTKALLGNLKCAYDTSGRVPFYRGNIPTSKLAALKEDGGDHDAFVPIGVSTCRGLLSKYMIERLVYRIG